MNPARALARREDGVALIMAVLILAVMMIAGTAVIDYTSSNSRSASYSKASGSAHALAEAGVAEAMAVLSLPENNALNPYLLPATTSTYPGGTVTWSGTLNQSAATWTITSTGFKANPTGPANDVRRTHRDRPRHPLPRLSGQQPGLELHLRQADGRPRRV